MKTSSIRIIGGRNKGYRIVFKASLSLRPTSDRAKETLFSWLQFEIQNKSCLDLFSGTGGLGFEALSRGAKHVTFIEKDKMLFKNIMKNVENLKYQDQTDSFCGNALKWIKKSKSKFDFIFLDPPFDQVKYRNLLATINNKDLLNENGKIYLEISKHTEVEVRKNQKIIKDKTVGDVRLMILQ